MSQNATNRIARRTEFKPCLACDYQAVTIDQYCPRCAGRLPNPATIRALGGAATFLGIVISAAMSAVIFFHARMISAPGSGSNWKASPGQTKLIFAILISVPAFGLMLSITGIRHLLSGRRHLTMSRATLGFGLLLWLAMEIIAAIVA